MFRIGEFSKLTQVSIRMLRYYDETGLLKPAQVAPFSGYRLYSVDQIPTLHRIIFLRDTGFNVSEIGVALSQWNDGFISAELANKRQEVLTVIRQEQERLAKIGVALNDIRDGKIAVICNVALKSVPSYQVLSCRKIIPDYFSEGLLWAELTSFIKQEGISLTSDSHQFAIYHDLDCRDANVDVEVCTVVNCGGRSKDGLTFRETEPVESMAYAMVYGPFENIASAYASFAHWLTQHNQYRMLGKSRQICHRGPWNEATPDNYLTEIQIPVEKAEL